jgi:hypothetical protein
MRWDEISTDQLRWMFDEMSSTEMKSDNLMIWNIENESRAITEMVIAKSDDFDWDINQWINESINQWINKSINLWMNQFLNLLTNSLKNITSRIRIWDMMMINNNPFSPLDHWCFFNLSFIISLSHYYYYYPQSIIINHTFIFVFLLLSLHSRSYRCIQPWRDFDRSLSLLPFSFPFPSFLWFHFMLFHFICFYFRSFCFGLPDCIVLYCIVLHCIVLYCAVLDCLVLDWISFRFVWSCIVSDCRLWYVVSST